MSIMTNAEMLKKLNQNFDNQVEIGTYIPSLSEREIGCKPKAEVFMIDGVMVADPVYGYMVCEQFIFNFLRNREGWTKALCRKWCDNTLFNGLTEDLKEAIQKENFAQVI